LQAAQSMSGRPVPHRGVALLGLSLVLLLAAGSAQADELTIYTIPAPVGHDWSSPRSLALSVVPNAVSLRHPRHNHPIGHTYVEVRRDNGDHFITGMTSAPEVYEVKSLVEQKLGFGVLLENWPGRLMEQSHVEKEIAKRLRSGRVGVLSFKVRPSTGARLWRYYEEYKARGYDKVFASPNGRPRHGDGAGCSAFGAAFLEVAGLLTPDLERVWTKPVRIPETIVGGSVTRKRVPFREVFFGAGRRWAELHEPHVRLESYSPDRLYEWIKRRTAALERNAGPDRFGRLRSASDEPSLNLAATRRGRAPTLRVDATHVPTPTEPLWHGTVNPLVRSERVHGANWNLTRDGAPRPASTPRAGPGGFLPATLPRPNAPRLPHVRIPRPKLPRVKWPTGGGSHRPSGLPPHDREGQDKRSRPSPRPPRGRR
jgi:hypothetical protein